MRDVIQDVLAAEAEAQAVLQAARQEAEALVQASRAAAAALAERNRAAVRAEAERILAAAAEQAAAQEREQLAGIERVLQADLRLGAEDCGRAVRQVVAAVLGQQA